MIGLFSIFWVAGNIPAKTFAILGVYQVISGIMLVFSNTGLETFAIRNVLAWREEKKYEKIKQLVSQAILLRFIVSLVLLIPAGTYAIYISINKFNGEYLDIFILMALFSVIGAVNNSIVLLLRSFNRYFTASLIMYSISIFSRFIALFVFIKYGFYPYIYVTIFLPVIIFLSSVFVIKDWLSFKGILDIKQLTSTLKESKAFLFSSYVSYSYNHMDQLIVSIFLSPEFLSSFSIGKRVLLFSKTFIENIFDPMIQKLVQYKNKKTVITQKLTKIYKIRNIIIGASILLSPILLLYIDDFILQINLKKYLHLNYFIIIILISQIMHVGMKVNYNFISLFYPASLYFKLTIFLSIASIISFLTLIMIDVRLIFAYTGISYFIMMLYTNNIMKRKAIL